ncbi:hypothetical protein D3C76_1376520 [compost metagenome]
MITTSKPVASAGPALIRRAGNIARSSWISAWALASVRLPITSSRISSASNAWAMPVAAPPAPSSNTRLSCRSWPCFFRPATKPSPSNMRPLKRPSGRRLATLHTFSRRAVPWSSSHNVATSSLCGTVTITPARFSIPRNPSHAVARLAGDTSQGTNTPSYPRRSSSGLKNSGVRRCLAG